MFPERLLLGNQKNPIDKVEKEEQAGRGVSQDVVVSLLNDIFRKTFVGNKKKSMERR